MNYKVGIIGSGSWGTTVGHLIALNGYKVSMYSRNKKQIENINKEHINKKYLPEFKLSKNIEASNSLKEVTENSDIIFIAVPSHSFRDTVKKMSNYLRPDQIVISLTKGIEIKTYNVMSQIISQESCIKLIGVLSGPNLAKEIMKNQPAATVIASKFDFVIKTVSKVISSDRFMVFAQRDVTGVEVAGALKNVIAIASGIGEGLGLGINATSFLVTLGISEIKYLALKLGAKPETFYGLAGTGDLMATSFSVLSRNFRFGKMVGKSNGIEEALKSVNQVVEGYTTTEVAHLFAKSININMPILEAVYRILYKKGKVDEVLSELLKIRKDYLWE